MWSVEGGFSRVSGAGQLRFDSFVYVLLMVANNHIPEHACVSPTQCAYIIAQPTSQSQTSNPPNDQGPLGKDAVTEIHNIFKWAKNSPRGLILFIDEAEAFLSSREKDHSENIRNAVSANAGENILTAYADFLAIWFIDAMSS